MRSLLLTACVPRPEAPVGDPRARKQVLRQIVTAAAQNEARFAAQRSHFRQNDAGRRGMPACLRRRGRYRRKRQSRTGHRPTSQTAQGPCRPQHRAPRLGSSWYAISADLGLPGGLRRLRRCARAAEFRVCVTELAADGDVGDASPDDPDAGRSPWPRIEPEAAAQLWPSTVRSGRPVGQRVGGYGRRDCSQPQTSGRPDCDQEFICWKYSGADCHHFRGDFGYC
jgi:hypothetical protein